MPNGSLWKQKRPNGVIKVVNNAESGDRGTCQRPELASSLEKMMAPEIWARTWSTDGRGCRSRQTLSLSLVRSTHIRTFQFGFGTTTIPVHQSVGCSTLAMTPRRSIRSSSSFTSCIRGIATLLTTHWENGVAFGQSLME